MTLSELVTETDDGTTKLRPSRRFARRSGLHWIEFPTRRPWGLVLLICLPECPPSQLAMHVAAARATANTIAIGLVDDRSSELREFVVGPVRRFDPTVALLDSTASWRLTGAPGRIFILGGERASLVAGDELKPLRDSSAAALERAYSRPEVATMSWRATAFHGNLAG